MPDFAHMTVALSGLTGKNASFIWLDEHQKKFDVVKELLTSAMVVTHFDPKLPVTVLTDASRLYGLGYAMGHFIDGRFKLVTCGSKSLTPTQQRYSTIELECLAVHFAVSKCSFYLKGSESFTVATSHTGVNRTYEMARCLYFWPGMLNDVKQLVESCLTFRKYRPSQPVNKRTTPAPSSYMGPPMGHVGMDLFDFGGNKFLV